ncbi:ATP-dependent RNA helicase HrpA [Nocardioides insulae]|uniref:ATP-dependent RNA helicase HrpA n=1 Tax=Nocardioides insulae TaxID=394734 RepID=UPI0004265A1C|nr:ATP-dependent RNA helicase HrpA [Nocardioides insulae]
MSETPPTPTGDAHDSSDSSESRPSHVQETAEPPTGGLRITYPPQLPVTQRRADIAEAIREHQVVIVAGETGSGKTTQLPKICLELGRGRAMAVSGDGDGDGITDANTNANRAGERGGRRRGRRTPRATGGLIGHTQPRRIAARSVAERIAQELGTELGDLVGYQVRFTDRTSKSSRVKLMTDGILLAELQRDRDLTRYDTIIIDEAHERSLNIDFLLGYLKRLLPRRPDLKLIITSATIDPERFAEHFADARTGEPAPIIEVSGRTYPVEVRYRPLMTFAGAEGADGGAGAGRGRTGPEADDEGEVIVRDQTEAIVDAVKELSAEGPGDILVFLPGEREIRDTADALRSALGVDRQRGAPVEITPLYSRLSAAEQHKVFQPHTGRRIVLATNVAETSLTVPGIRYVVDTGVARISRYSVRTKVQRLPIEPISQASASQRSGRCGRVEAGIAVRLYSEEDFEGRPEFTDPEILRTNLASVILQMASLGLGDVARFPFVEPPDRRNISAGTQLLEELGALGAGETPDPKESGRSPRRLTGLGRRLARLPVDPRLGRMILEAERLGCVRDVLVIAAALSLQDPRERPGPDQPAEQARADQLHARFKHEASDFLTFLNLWRYLKEQQRELSSSAFRRMCLREHLHYLRVREWQDFESQLRQVCREMKIDLGSAGSEPGGTSNTSDETSQQTNQQAKGAAYDADGIHQALLSGLLSHIGLLEEREKSSGAGREKKRRGPREYLGARGARFAVFPGSVLSRKNPQFLMAGELVETSRLWARQNAAIQPEWAERLAGDLAKRTYSEPHWSTRRAAVMARERVTLYGVPLVADRPVNYGRIDADLSRELFIRHALVYGEWPGAAKRHRFLADNQRLLEEAAELEHRARRHDIVVDEHALFDFYDARVGREVVSGAHFDTWWKMTRREQPALLTFDPAMLTLDTAEEVTAADYPTVWEDGGLTFDLSYHFEPGTAEDGLTVDVPVATLNRVGADDFSWNVPGLREELVTALIRSLPKNLRVSFVPAPDQAREFLRVTPPGEEPLLDALERWGRSTKGVVIPRDAWDWTKVPEHLRPTYRIVDEAGREQARGKDLDSLKAPLRGEFEQAIAEVAADAGLSSTGQTAWTFGEVAREVTEKRAGHEVTVHPCLVDEGASVGLRVVGSREEAAARHRLGVSRLLILDLDRLDPRLVPRILDSLTTADKLALVGSPYSSASELVGDARTAVVRAAVDSRPEARDRPSYDALLAAAGSDLEASVRAVLQDALRALEGYREVDKLVSGRTDLRTLPALTDLRGQLARLVHDGFIAEAGPAMLRRYPTYFRAMVHRRDRLESNLSADQRLMDQYLPLEEAYLHQVAALPEGRPPGERLRRVRWMLEEYRVSLWAQQYGTAFPVSDTRIRKALG